MVAARPFDPTPLQSEHLWENLMQPPITDDGSTDAPSSTPNADRQCSSRLSQDRTFGPRSLAHCRPEAVPGAQFKIDSGLTDLFLPVRRRRAEGDHGQPSDDTARLTCPLSIN